MKSHKYRDAIQLLEELPAKGHQVNVLMCRLFLLPVTKNATHSTRKMASTLAGSLKNLKQEAPIGEDLKEALKKVIQQFKQDIMAGKK